MVFVVSVVSWAMLVLKGKRNWNVGFSATGDGVAFVEVKFHGGHTLQLQFRSMKWLPTIYIRTYVGRSER